VTVPVAARDENRLGASRSALEVQIGFRSERGERPQNEEYAAVLRQGGAHRVIIAVPDGVKGGRLAAELALGDRRGMPRSRGVDFTRTATVHGLEAMNPSIHLHVRS
jgi:hypothetical protein